METHATRPKATGDGCGGLAGDEVRGLRVSERSRTGAGKRQARTLLGPKFSLRRLACGGDQSSDRTVRASVKYVLLPHIVSKLKAAAAFLACCNTQGLSGR